MTKSLCCTAEININNTVNQLSFDRKKETVSNRLPFQSSKETVNKLYHVHIRSDLS